jgi:hypothetical protein
MGNLNKRKRRVADPMYAVSMAVGFQASNP